jgi:ferritin-like metal-binding protein YciE
MLMKNSVISNSLFLEKLRILFNSEKQLNNYLYVIQHKSQSLVLQSLLHKLIEISHSYISCLQFLFKKLKVPQQAATCEKMKKALQGTLLK